MLKRNERAELLYNRIRGIQGSYSSTSKLSELVGSPKPPKLPLLGFVEETRSYGLSTVKLYVIKDAVVSPVCLPGYSRTAYRDSPAISFKQLDELNESLSDLVVLHGDIFVSARVNKLEGPFGWERLTRYWGSAEHEMSFEGVTKLLPADTKVYIFTQENLNELIDLLPFARWEVEHGGIGGSSPV